MKKSVFKGVVLTAVIAVLSCFTAVAAEPQADVKLIDLALRDLREKRDSSMARKLLELGCQKIDAIYNENPQKAREIGLEIAKFAK